MPFRMAEYCPGIITSIVGSPSPLCVYVGNPRMQLPKQLRGDDVLSLRILGAKASTIY